MTTVKFNLMPHKSQVDKLTFFHIDTPPVMLDEVASQLEVEQEIANAWMYKNGLSAANSIKIVFLIETSLLNSVRGEELIKYL